MTQLITAFDDYCIHQTTDPIAQPFCGERNFYDRYWFDGFDQGGKFVFEVGFGLYPNRQVMDGHFSVVVDGVQHAFHASCRAPLDRTQTTCGPLRIEVIEPMRRIRVVVAPNDKGIACDLTFLACTTPFQEDKNLMREGVRVLMDTTRFTQFGRWEGSITIQGVTLKVERQTTLGIRDKSWGYRPVGERETGAPGKMTNDPGVYWVWSVTHFDGFCTQYGTFQDFDGKPTQESGAIIPAYASLTDIPAQDPAIQRASQSSHAVKWQSGTRWATAATVHLTDPAGVPYDLTLTPLLRFQMLGIGYQHPEWGHGFWKGEAAYAGESWRLDELEPLDYMNIHVHQIVKATLQRGGETLHGVGLLETVCFGRHPSGFREILDGAP